MDADVFNLRISGNSLRSEKDIAELVDFINNLKEEERRRLGSYAIAYAYLQIGDFYYDRNDLKKAYEFYNSVLDIKCDRPFINRDSYFKMGRVLFQEKRFKEALVSFVSVLSFDRDNEDVIKQIGLCLDKLNVLEHKAEFLKATPKEARKLIMEIL